MRPLWNIPTLKFDLHLNKYLILSTLVFAVIEDHKSVQSRDSSKANLSKEVEDEEVQDDGTQGKVGESSLWRDLLEFELVFGVDLRP